MESWNIWNKTGQERWNRGTYNKWKRKKASKMADLNKYVEIITLNVSKAST